MKNIIKYIPLFLILLLITKWSDAQYSNFYPANDAEMLQLNGSSQTESIVGGAVISLSSNQNLLTVRLNIPFHSLNIQHGYDSLFSSGLSFDLKVNVNAGQIQEYLTSARTLTTHGFLMLNNITKPVIVQYIPLPAGTELNGDFNISMIIQFNSGEFDLGGPLNDSQFIIKLSEATVNRV